MVGRRSFPFGMAYGEGWTVRFRECKCPVSYKMFKVDPNPGTFIASTKNFICKKWWLFVFSLWVAQQIRLIGFTFNGEFCLARMAVIEMHEKNIENKKTCSAIHWFRHRPFIISIFVWSRFNPIQPLPSTSSGRGRSQAMGHVISTP